MSQGPEAREDSAEHMNRAVFGQELNRCIGELAASGVEIPEEIRAEIDQALDPFSKRVFRLAAASLLDGLNPRMLPVEGGPEIVLERLMSMPYNLRDAMTIEDLIAEPELPHEAWDVPEEDYYRVGLEGWEAGERDLTEPTEPTEP